MLRRRALMGLTALGLVTALATPALGAGGQNLKWKFDSAGSPVTTVVDDSGKLHTGTVTAANGGQITTLTPGRDGIGQAVQFPALCVGAGCPKAMITTPSQPDLNPGTGKFSYGAWVKLTTAQLSSTTGSNVLQKGLSDSSQWKLQIDPHNGVLGLPSCVVRRAGGLASMLVRSDISVADGNWHKLVCQRTDTGYLQIYVDNNFRQQVLLPAPAYDLAPAGQLTVGAKNLGADNDQYYGQLDEVFYNDYLAYPPAP
jgi:hypothetical protein